MPTKSSTNTDQSTEKRIPQMISTTCSNASSSIGQKSFQLQSFAKKCLKVCYFKKLNGSCLMAEPFYNGGGEGNRSGAPIGFASLSRSSCAPITPGPKNVPPARFLHARDGPQA